MKVLLDPSNTEGGGGEAPKAAPIATPQTDQMQSFKGAPAMAPERTVTIPQNLKGTVFDVSDEPDIEYPEHKEATPANEFKKEEGEKKVEAKVETKVEPKVETDVKPPKIKAGLPEKIEAKVTPQPGKEELGGRDYSIFPDDVKEDIKKTGNNAFKFISKTYSELKKIKEELDKVKPELENLQKGGLPQQWYSHPDAWRLHPEAQKQNRTIQKVEYEEGFWYEQLQKIEAGEQYQLLRGYDKNGQPVLSDPIEPSGEAKTQLILTVGKLQAAKENLYVGLNRFAQGFQQQYQQQEQAIEQVIDEQWPWNKDEKHPAQKWSKEFLEILPPEQRGTQLGRVASYLYASYQKALELLEERGKETEKEELKQEIKRDVEPKVASPSAGASLSSASRNGVKVKTFSLDGME